MSFLKRFSRAFLWNHLNKIVGYLLDFILSIVLARGLGDYNYGVYSELFNFVFLFSLICSLGLDTALNVYLPKIADQPARISHLLRKTFQILAVESILVGMFLYFGAAPLSQLIHSPHLNQLLKIVACYIFCHNFLIIAEVILICFYATQLLFLVNVGLKIGFICSAYFILTQGGTLQQILIAFVILSSIASSLYLIRFSKVLRPKPISVNLKEYFKFGLIAWITKFVNYILGRYFDIFLLGYFMVSKPEIGYYNIAFSITLAMFYLFTAGFGGVTTAAFAGYEQQGNRQAIARGWLQVTKICIFFGVPVFLYVIVNAHAIIPVVYSDAYRGSIPLLQVFAGFFLLTIVIGSGVNPAILYVIRQEKTELYLRLALGLVNVVLDLLLIPRFRALGAIVATGIATLTIIGLEYRFVRKFIQPAYPYQFLFKILFAAFVTVGISLVLMKSNLVELILNSIVSGFGFLGTLYLLKPLSTEDKQYFLQINPWLGKLAGKF